jgi:hypothetical protein
MNEWASGAHLIFSELVRLLVGVVDPLPIGVRSGRELGPNTLFRRLLGRGSIRPSSGDRQSRIARNPTPRRRSQMHVVPQTHPVFGQHL